LELGALTQAHKVTNHQNAQRTWHIKALARQRLWPPLLKPAFGLLLLSTCSRLSGRPVGRVWLRSKGVVQKVMHHSNWDLVQLLG
jgi:uncharacterized protein (DUF2062 family)